MQWNVVTLFPEEMQQILSLGLIGQAFKKNILQLDVYNPRDFAFDRHKTVDDRPFGGGDGMVLQADVLSLTLTQVLQDHPVTEFFYLSPQGPVLNEAWVQSLAKKPSLSLICGRYGGIDQRLLNEWKIQEISIGDYVLAGGELAAGVVIEACSRKITGVLGHEQSAELDSHASGWLESPLMTRPRVWKDQQVPEILLSGDHKKIQGWKYWVSILVTIKKRPDIYALYKKDIKLSGLIEFWKQLSTADRRVLGLAELQAEDLK